MSGEGTKVLCLKSAKTRSVVTGKEIIGLFLYVNDRCESMSGIVSEFRPFYSKLVGENLNVPLEIDLVCATFDAGTFL